MNQSDKPRLSIVIFDEDSLTYKAIERKKFVIIGAVAFTSLLISFFIGIMAGTTTNRIVGCDHWDNDYEINMMMSRYDVYPENADAWKDSTFKDYEERARLWLKRPSLKGTPLKGGMMALCARNAFDSTGIFLPIELALAQAKWESDYGRNGRSPINNPYNVGENDSGTTMWFENTFEGVQAYYYYMCKNYLRCRTIDQLFVNFVNCGGKRYASSDAYEYHISGSYYTIKRWLEKNLKD